MFLLINSLRIGCVNSPANVDARAGNPGHLMVAIMVSSGDVVVVVAGRRPILTT